MSRRSRRSRRRSLRLSARIAELFVGGEGLVQGAESVLETLLHEAAHGVADVRKIKDTSRQGRYHNARYHNARYKVLGEELGLVITQHPQIGWSLTELRQARARSMPTNSRS